MTGIKQDPLPDESGSAKKKGPTGGGDPVQQANKWGGGSKGSKGEVTEADRANEQSSAKR